MKSDTHQSTETGFAQSLDMLSGIGPKSMGLLAQLGVETLGDLLLHMPRRYEDRRHITPMAEAVLGENVTVRGEVVSARNVRMRGRMSMAVLRLKDDTGEMTVTFFGRGFLANSTFTPGKIGLFTGKVESYKGPALKNPEYELLSGDDEDRLHTGRIVPIYRLTDGLSQRRLRRWIFQVLGEIDGSLPESLPPFLQQSYDFPPYTEALQAVHFPETPEAADQARKRFAYEELLAMQTGILWARHQVLDQETGIQQVINGAHLKALGKALPFELTEAQDRVISELFADMVSPRPMARLIQGDVGCGKTVVALHAVAACLDGGHQAAIMAPTEILAEQHALHLKGMLEPLGVNVALLTGSTANAKLVRESIADGIMQVVVGTHALFQEKTQFHRLGLVVIDEQHRFGVTQRQRLAAKGVSPDILHMSATPIPRTLAITVYGGMDISLIDQLPPGRLPVKTRRVTPKKLGGMYDYIREEAGKGFQTFIICPLIEGSETREDLTPVIDHFEALSYGPLAGLEAALLHGRLDPSEKDAIMQRFKAKEIDVLFSTTVIEVGIDVDTATTMVIENADQFGLTQLHQLRGRVGRGSVQSYCFLLGKPRTEDGKKRLEILCEFTSGFDIAEADLELRGPGEFYGVRQAGLSDLRVADLIRDVRLLDQARRDAIALLECDPALNAKEHQALRKRAERFGVLNV